MSSTVILPRKTYLKTSVKAREEEEERSLSSGRGKGKRVKCGRGLRGGERPVSQGSTGKGWWPGGAGVGRGTEGVRAVWLGLGRTEPGTGEGTRGHRGCCGTW